ncbi:MAG TPA: DUF5715 family protein, partial [Pyrinomonadaceae bacterium]|nr:DUF5715 family protein [Pyrinomonadaceae bacterium]
VWGGAVLLALLALFAASRKGRQAGLELPLPGGGAEEAAAEAVRLSPFQEAVLKVEEERGEPVGRRAEVSVPAQLKHYSDRKRFLATQVAEAREQRLRNPSDYAELAEMIRAGELVELPQLGEHHVLYGVGLSADDGPFTHYDPKTGESVTLFADDAELQAEYLSLDEAVKAGAEKIKALKDEAVKAGKEEKERRAELRKQTTEEEKLLAAARKRKALLKKYYDRAEVRRHLASDYEKVSALASDFGGRSYDLRDAASRKELKMRMLSFARPQAVSVLDGVARSYRERFGRHLPVTSLVRTEEYQRRLGRTNANATRIATPPHTTGLAFDIFYRFMTAEEQQHVMSDLARLRDEARIEVLRELRDHFHVFAFADGERPSETLIARSREAAGAQDEDEGEPAVRERPTRSQGKERQAAKQGKEKQAAKPGRERQARKPAAKPAPKRTAKRR